jgi:hypothetical protein
VEIFGLWGWAATMPREWWALRIMSRRWPSCLVWRVCEGWLDWCL